MRFIGGVNISAKEGEPVVAKVTYFDTDLKSVVDCEIPVTQYRAATEAFQMQLKVDRFLKENVTLPEMKINRNV